jgi:phosphoglucosamine mutase
MNINRDCGATHPQTLQAAVLEHHADVGIAFDGDGDRLQMVDEHGALADGDDLLYVLASDRHRRGVLRGPVVGTLMTNFGVERAITDLGVEFVRSNVGDRYVLQLLKQSGGRLGGEASGHLLALDVSPTGDGIVSALLVLDALKRAGVSLAQARSKLQRVSQFTINLPIVGGSSLISKDNVKSARAHVEETLRGRGRVVLRASGTEPLIRVTVEGEDAAEVRRLADSLAEAVKAAAN